MSEHIVSRKIYFSIFGILLGLTALTTFVAFQDLGPFNIVVALLIALVKAGLVILFFMHVKYSSRLTKVFIAAGFLWFLIMVSFTFADYYSRGWIRQIHP
jgi:cytochrome c oxidase subunit 4